MRLNSVYKYLVGGNEDGARPVSVVSIATSEGNGHILKHRRLCLNNRKHISTLRVAEHGTACQRSCGVSFLGDIRNQLDLILSRKL